ncbi:M50 family metallopeptidase [Hymenobacter amundsenii]|nr:M50 family metallopeptidase [Hymenobacter amundsenii]
MLDFSKPDTPKSALTPEQLKRKKRRQGLFNVSLSLGLVLWLKGADWFNSFSSKADSLQLPWLGLLLLWLPLLLSATFLAVLIHEIGHISGALLADFKIVEFNTGVLLLERKPDGWKTRLQKFSYNMVGKVRGYTTNYEHLRRRYILVVASGPTVNLLSGGFALLLLATLPALQSSPAESTLLKYLFTSFFSVFGWISVLLGVIGFIPLTTTSGDIPNGLMLLHLLRRDKAMYQQLFLLQLSGDSYAGIRPRLWKDELISSLLSYSSETISNNVLDCYAHCWAYAYFDDCHDFEKAQLHLNEAIERKDIASASVQQYLFCEAACIAVLQTNNAAQARLWLNQARQVKPFTEQEGLFAQAAVTWAEGNSAEAGVFLRAAHKQLQNSITSGFNIQAAERIHDLQSKIEQIPFITASA